MTDKERAAYRATAFTKLNYNEPDNYGTPKEIGYHAYHCGFLAGLAAGRTVWHKVADDDLPNEHVLVLIYTILANYYVTERVGDDFRTKDGSFIPASTVIAWCEIPKYKEE